jgi:anti-sigma factor RsiW
MRCPIEAPENAELLLDYCARKLSPEVSGVLERHMAICPACREFAEGQQAVWQALDQWEAAPVSMDFDRRLYKKIEERSGWRELLARPLRALIAYRAVPAMAVVALVIAGGVMLQRPAAAPDASPQDLTIVEGQAEQVEQAMDAMDMLSEYSRRVRPEGTRSKL